MSMFRLRGILMLPPLAIMTLCTWNECSLEVPYLWIGAGIFALGFTVRLWAQLHLHYRLKIKTTLTMTGPYALIRNPIYIGNTLILLGICVMTRLIWLTPILVIYCFVVYSLVVREEEAHLKRRYGAPYLAYMETTARWFPKLSALRDPHRPTANTRQFVVPSLVAEAHNLVFLFPVAIKYYWISG